MKAPETDEDFIQWYEDCWADRDEVEYPKMFGAIDEGVFTLDQTDAIQAWMESEIAQVEGEPDPNWGPMGVRVAKPSPDYPYWTYVTSGLSNPFTIAPGEEIAPDAPSGIGYEMVIHTPEEAKWPVFRLLDMMAYNLVCMRAFALNHRYPVEGTLDGGDSKLSGFVFVRDPSRPDHFALESGKVQLLTLVGVTKNEMAFARSNGMDKLMEKLVAAGSGYITRPERDEVKL
ncbi:MULTISPECIES: suppressor of fused domain protein [Myxococcus]|uniref:suppressor of fused domain protein n=1 Tax=Myxococcus TaxID=32 RepID=UPI0011447FF5|nr:MULTISPECIES: suppressor of fused domain protein [Myxococcus]MCK8501377.1 suppressor of fused domain protein [Myxococcus fulvus]